MLKPYVGVIVLMSYDMMVYMGTSLASDLRMVVLPALSRPSTRIFSSYFLFLRRLRNMPIKPPPWF